MKIEYGTTGPGQLMEHLRDVCFDETAMCNNLNKEPLKIPTKVWAGEHAEPKDATLTLIPDSDMDNEPGEAEHFVDAMVALARAGRQCEEREWLAVPQSLRGVPVMAKKGKDTFCTMSNQLQIRKENFTTGALISNLRVGVEMKLKEPEGFNWCSVLGLGSSISGAFDKGAGFSSAFGITEWICDLATGA
jgi:hypothetical protein